ncbi:DUF3995 domain-containing protein [Streptomyces sp. NPDC006879]|uniref:DUF3995 domain-containing protein n=1 Tax=Streptomyces sp. NPDC006879 TaxID=3364767 RepID=UPI00369BD8D8
MDTVGENRRGGTVRAAAGTAAAGLAAAGALHVAWTRTPWPLSSPAEFASVVVGVEESRLPSTTATLTVAGLLGTGAALVAATGARPQGRLIRSGVWTVAGVLAARGLGGLAASSLELGRSTPEFRRWDLRLYSPLCLTLAGLSGYVAARTRSVEPTA